MRTTPADRIADFTDKGWWGGATLTSIFDQAVSSSPHSLALVDPFNRSDLTDGNPQRLTFSEIASRVENIAAILHAHGVGQDDIVVIQLPNVVELVMLYIALARLGTIVSPVPVQYGVHELKKIQQESWNGRSLIQASPLVFLQLSVLELTGQLYWVVQPILMVE